MSYTAPVKDMLFCMKELADLEAISRLPGFDAAGLETALGGGVSAETIPFIEQVGTGLVDRFETRKVIFCCQNGRPAPDADKGILKAVGFELMWLKNKRDFYGLIASEDATRLEMLQSRYDKLIKAAGGMYE